LIACLSGLVLAAPAHAQEKDMRHWIARIGVHPVHPKPDSETDYDAGNGASLSLGATYLFTKHWGLELFGAFPAAFDLQDSDGDNVARFDMIPVSATVQYHISDAGNRFRAYVGAGVVHARLGDEQTLGALSGSTLKLGDSTGVAATIGLDMRLTSLWFVNIDARWFDIDSSMKVSGAARDRLELDPYLFGLSLGRQLR
jgi:outer membrane protein